VSCRPCAADRLRQLFAIPVTREMTLVAVGAASTTPATAGTHTLALARDILGREGPGGS
jgi:hypothetical protein